MIETTKDEVHLKTLEAIPLPIGQAVDGVSPEKIARLGLPLIKLVASLHSKTIIYPAIKNLSENELDRLESILFSEKILGEIVFWDTIARIYVIQESGGVESLQADGLEFEKGEDRSTFLARVLSTQPEKLNSLLFDLLARSSSDFGGKTFHIFNSSLSSIDIEKKRGLLSESVIFKALEKPFEKRGYGKPCEIIPIKKNENWGFLINRGTHRVTNAVLDREEKKRFRDDRRIKTDAVFLNTETNTLWVNCSGKNDAQMYSEIMGELFGKTNVFHKRQVFELSPFLKKDLGTDLARIAKALKVYSVEIRKIEILVAETGALTKLKSGRWDPCLTERYFELKEIDVVNDVKWVQVRLILSADGKLYQDSILRPGTLRLNSGCDPLLMSQMLTSVGCWTLYGNC